MDNSRLSSLSDELRNMIYTELFTIPDGIHLNIDEDLNVRPVTGLHFRSPSRAMQYVRSRSSSSTP